LVYTHSDSESDLEEVWSEEEDQTFLENLECEEEPPSAHTQLQAGHSKSKALAMWLLHFLLSFQAVYHISDKALAFFLKFLSVFFSVLGQFCKISAEIAGFWPSSLYQAKLCISKPKFRKYVVCKKCHKIYYFSECIEGSRSAPSSK